MTIDRLTMHEMKVRRTTIVSGYASIDGRQKMPSMLLPLPPLALAGLAPTRCSTT